MSRSTSCQMSFRIRIVASTLLFQFDYVGRNYIRFVFCCCAAALVSATFSCGGPTMSTNSSQDSDIIHEKSQAHWIARLLHMNESDSVSLRRAIELTAPSNELRKIGIIYDADLGSAKLLYRDDQEYWFRAIQWTRGADESIDLRMRPIANTQAPRQRMLTYKQFSHRNAKFLSLWENMDSHELGVMFVYSAKRGASHNLTIFLGHGSLMLEISGFCNLMPTPEVAIRALSGTRLLIGEIWREFVLLQRKS